MENFKMWTFLWKVSKSWWGGCKQPSRGATSYKRTTSAKSTKRIAKSAMQTPAHCAPTTTTLSSMNGLAASGFSQILSPLMNMSSGIKNVGKKENSEHPTLTTTSSDMEDDSDTGLSFCEEVNQGDSEEEEVLSSLIQNRLPHLEV